KETAERLVKDNGAKVILFGGKDDREICSTVLDDLTGLNLAGEIDIRKSIALISRCNLFITNDSGPMHIAAALGIPTVAIFGSTDPKLTRPLGDNVRVIKKNIECSPCFDRECRYGHYNCMKMVTVQDVYEMGDVFLSGKKREAENF
ncbi:MAG TPA: glycosyltransferase family 9 protein, partial [Thermodesulfobacteriota bacterium]|nr:glycosyltransferase family 9 protein [Thermodesulfobacteriota bacterium]